MILHFLLTHLSDKLFGARRSSQRLLLFYIVVVAVSLAGWATLCLVREGRERKDTKKKGVGTLKTKSI